MLKFLAVISVYLVLKEFQDVEAASTKCEKTVTTMSGLKKPSKDICSGDLIFEETFDTFDLDIWSHEISLAGRDAVISLLLLFYGLIYAIIAYLQNWEFQQYTNNRSNSFVEDGNLNIKPTLTGN